MKTVTAREVRSVIINHFHDAIARAGFDPAAVCDDFDMLTQGVIDSIGVVEMVAAIEKQFDISLDLANLDPESLTILGPLSRFVEQQTLHSNGNANANGRA
jgi:acyl carrier protein